MELRKGENAPVSALAPLSGIRVLDLTRMVAGPTAAQMLADLGAEVLKVERPGHGDEMRHVNPRAVGADGSKADQSTYFLAVNRGKRSVTIDFSRPEGASLLARLASRYDVLLENYRPGTLAKHGLSYGDLSAANPALIYCSITGFGQSGPYAQRSGYDYLVQGMAGLMSVNGPAEGGPTRVGIPVADYGAGQNAVIGVLAALNSRHRTGRGQQVDVALFDTQFAMMLNVFSSWMNAGESIPRQGNEHQFACPHEVFDVADGQIIIATFSDDEFRRLAEALDHPEWARMPEFATNGNRLKNRERTIATIESVLRTNGKDHWIARLNQHNIVAGPINDMADLALDPHIAARRMIVDLADETLGTVRTIGCPIKFSAHDLSYRIPPPKLGEHTRDVLSAELRMGEQEIGELRKLGVI